MIGIKVFPFIIITIKFPFNKFATLLKNSKKVPYNFIGYKTKC